MLHGESSKRLATPRNTKDKITYNQPNRPNRQTPQTKHKALPKGQPGRRTPPINTAAVHASAQQQPTISTHTRQGHHQIFSDAAKPRSNTGGLAEQAGWLRRRAEPHNTTDSTRLSGDTQRPPPPESGVSCITLAGAIGVRASLSARPGHNGDVQGCYVTRRKPPTPGAPKEHNKTENTLNLVKIKSLV